MRVETIGQATLYLADCREVYAGLPRMNAMVVSDPQYGAGRFVSNHNSGRRGMGAALIRTDGDFKANVDQGEVDPSPWLIYGGVVLWGANHFCDKLPSGHRWLSWDKLDGKTPVPGTSDMELAWTSSKGPSRTFTHLWRGIMRAGEENVANGPKLHPHQKPVELMKWSIDLQRKGASIVIDPYMGSGSTGVAALRCGLQFVGVEMDPAYFDVACERLENEQRQARLLA